VENSEDWLFLKLKRPTFVEIYNLYYNWYWDDNKKVTHIGISEFLETNGWTLDEFVTQRDAWYERKRQIS
jgi:hypothetical protein